MSSVDDARPEPGLPVFRLVPKPGGGARRLTDLHPFDRESYRRVVAGLADMLERVLGPSVVANRIRPGTTVGLRSWRIERDAFGRRRRRLVASHPFVVKADVRECYPSMGPAAVEASLVRLGAHPSEVRPLRRMLERLQERGVLGLPVGPEASAVVANGVLASADDAVRAAGARHLRWVDDVWAGAQDERHGAEILDRLRESLSRMGLSLNEAKTRILDRAEAWDLVDPACDETGYR